MEPQPGKLLMRLVRIILCLFLLAQFAAVAHAYEHDSLHEQENDCVICLQHSSSENATNAPYHDYQVSVFPAEAIHTEIESLHTQTQYNTDPRGPPGTL